MCIVDANSTYRTAKVKQSSPLEAISHLLNRFNRRSMRNTYRTSAHGERKMTSTVRQNIRDPCDRNDCGEGQVSLKRADCPNLDAEKTRGSGGMMNESHENRESQSGRQKKI